MLSLSVFAFVAASALASPVRDAERLRSVTVLHRHGYRGPLTSYPTDPHGNETIWNNGFGQLTNKGKAQMRDLGKWLRKRYDGFLPVIYNDRDVYARATEVTRDMMSAYVVLSGLYEPTGTDVWDPQVRWQPIPVHATPLADEHTLMSVADCPRLTKLFAEVMESEYVRRKFDSFSETTKVISEKAGYEGNKIPDSIWLFDVFQAQLAHGLEIPEWARSFYPQPLRGMLAFLYSLQARGKPLQRLTCGPLLKEVLAHTDDVISGNSTYKFRLYSGHDFMIVDFMRCLGVDDEELVPPFGAALLVELHERGGDHFIAVKYKAEDELRTLTLPGCEELCNVETFRELVRPVVPEEWVKECQV